jgi:hypothetical protein
MEATRPICAALDEVRLRPVQGSEESRYQEQMAQHHYLGALPKIGASVWYVATGRDQWVAQLSLSAAALKCGVRDRWIGSDFRSQYGRLKLIANNRRFLILPDWHRPNVGARVLSLLERRGRLAGTLRPSVVAARNVCGSAPLSWRGVSRRELDGTGADAGLSPGQRWL